MERQDLIRQLVRSWKAVTPEPRPLVVVVATGDDDGTPGWCKNQKLKVISQKEPLSFAKACNRGAKAAFELVPTAEWLLLLNNDLILHPSFWQGFAEARNANYEIIGGKLLYPDGTIQHYGKMYTLDYFPFHVLRGQPTDHAEAQDTRPFPSVTFACVAIKRLIWEALGGLDEQYANGYEDDDFCAAAREKGAEIGVHPLMLATHLESQTSGKDNANKAAQWEKFKAKWIETNRIAWPLGVFPQWRWT